MAMTREPWEDGPPPGWDDGQPPANDPGHPFAIIDTAGIFAPLPPIPWVCQGLGLAPGAASMLAGYGFSGKTVIAQSLGLSIASGKDVFGIWSAKRGPVIHFDYEVGERLLRERYQRLARGMGIRQEALEDRLQLVVFPSCRLDSPTAVDAYTRVLEGKTLAIFDPLKSAAPTGEENSSDMRRYIDVVSYASEKTGCMTLVLHHSKKPSNEDAGGAKAQLRGSSAIFDACASVFVMRGEKGKPTRVEHEKDRITGVCKDDFFVRIEDVAYEGDPRWGLYVRHLDSEQLEKKAPPTLKYETMKLAIWEAIKASPGLQSKNAVCARVELGSRQNRLLALDELVEEGKVVNGGETHGFRSV